MLINLTAEKKEIMKEKAADKSLASCSHLKISTMKKKSIKQLS
jgi:hypothetical protein